MMKAASTPWPGRRRMSKPKPKQRAGPPASRRAVGPAAAESRTVQTRARPVGRHLVVIGMAGALVAGFWASRPTWSAEMRLWKAVGDAALVLLVLALALGPMARLNRHFTRWLPWRRQLGIWFALVALAHGVLVVHGWARWSLRRFLGYEFVPQVGREVRLEPGFGLANLVGATALGFALVLAATSSDWALRHLGGSAWRWLHHGARFVFYLTLLHVGYFLFLHYTLSFHKAVPPPDWFRVPFVLTGVALISLQVAAFVKTAAKRSRQRISA